MAVATSRIVSIDPATEEVLAEFEPSTPEQVEAALAGTHAAYLRWRSSSWGERRARLAALAAALRDDKERLAQLMTAEMGKPVTQARAEVEKCATTCDFYAENAERFLGDERVATNARESMVAFEPLGVVLAVMPWNFPLWQVFRFFIPAVMAGNGAILKHASNVPQCALAAAELVDAAGFPQGLLRALLLQGGAVEPLIDDDRIRAVTLTGSSETGARIAARAGRNLKKAVLELGGSDPFIVLADADVAGAAKTAAWARNQNNGQSCIAAKRFIVDEAVGAQFERAFADAVRALRVGDPKDDATEVGPLARADLRDALERQVRESVAMGARLLTGGRRVEGRGYFFEPTVLADVTPDMPVFAEETFGPLAAVMRVRDADEAVRVANDSQYGLGAAVWTSDAELGKTLARRIESGQVFINGMVASDPRLPFGGVKRSGFGRELGSFGIREFVNIQTIWVGPAEQPNAVAAE